MMRSPVDNLKNGTFGHINYFKLWCALWKAWGKNMGKKRYTYRKSYIVPEDKKKKKKTKFYVARGMVTGKAPCILIILHTTHFSPSTYIDAQVVLFFIPCALHTFPFSKLELISMHLPSQRDMKSCAYKKSQRLIHWYNAKVQGSAAQCKGQVKDKKNPFLW